MHVKFACTKRLISAQTFYLNGSGPQKISEFQVPGVDYNCLECALDFVMNEFVDPANNL